MMDLSIIILSYNTKEITKQTLDHLTECLKKDSNIISEIIVVDNGSTDGSVKMLKSISDVHVLLNKDNVGFPKGNNQALAQAKGKYILFLNSDVYVEKLNFSDLLTYLDKNENTGVLTVNLILPNGKIDPASHRGFPTLWNSFCYFFFLEKIFGKVPGFNKLIGGYHLTYRDYGSIHEIDSPSGAFYLTRKSILEKTGGFDEDFFMYGEDLDLAYRIKKMGYKIMYYPKWTALHLKNASGLKKKDPEVEKKTKEYFYNAMKIFYRKHYADNYPFWINKLVYFFIDVKKKIS